MIKITQINIDKIILINKIIQNNINKIIQINISKIIQMNSKTFNMKITERVYKKNYKNYSNNKKILLVHL